ncbi:hypothetical protein AAHB53_05500 [Niallia circulans]
MEKENQNLFHIEETTIFEVQKALNSGQITSWELTKQYIERIKTFDSTLCSIREINPDALVIAAELDKKDKKWIKLAPFTVFQSSLRIILIQRMRCPQRRARLL